MIETESREAAGNTAGKTKAPKHKGLDPVIYGVGKSAEAGLYGWLGAGSIATLILRFGSKKNMEENTGKGNAIDWIRELPEKIGHAAKAGMLNVFKKLPGEAGEVIHRSFTGEGGAAWKRAAAIGFVAIGTIVSWITHSFGMAAGYRKAKKELQFVHEQAEDNVRLNQSVKLLTQDNARLQEELAKVQRPDIAASRGESSPSL